MPNWTINFVFGVFLWHVKRLFWYCQIHKIRAVNDFMCACENGSGRLLVFLSFFFLDRAATAHRSYVNHNHCSSAVFQFPQFHSPIPILSMRFYFFFAKFYAQNCMLLMFVFCSFPNKI